MRKQTCSFQVQVCLSMCDLLVDTRHIVNFVTLLILLQFTLLTHCFAEAYLDVKHVVAEVVSD